MPWPSRRVKDLANCELMIKVLHVNEVFYYSGHVYYDVRAFWQFKIKNPLSALQNHTYSEPNLVYRPYLHLKLCDWTKFNYKELTMGHSTIINTLLVFSRSLVAKLHLFITELIYDQPSCHIVLLPIITTPTMKTERYKWRFYRFLGIITTHLPRRSCTHHL